MGIEQGNVTLYHCRCINKEKPSLSLWWLYSSDPGIPNHFFQVLFCAQDTHLYLPCSTEERNKLPSCQLWAMLPDQGCLVYSGREITSLEMSFSWLAGPQLTAEPPEHLWSLRLTGVHAAASRDPGPGNPNLPSVNMSLRGSKVRYFKKVFFFFLPPWSFLWPPISNHSLAGTLSLPPQVHFSSMARFINHVTYFPCLSGLLTLSPWDWGFQENTVFCLFGSLL